MIPVVRLLNFEGHLAGGLVASGIRRHIYLMGRNGTVALAVLVYFSSDCCYLYSTLQ